MKCLFQKGIVTIESFTPDNKELAGAVCFWHPMADDQDTFAREGLRFLKNWATQSDVPANHYFNKSLDNGK